LPAAIEDTAVANLRLESLLLGLGREIRRIDEIPGRRRGLIGRS
jgi:hypothetical protein